MDSNNRNNRNGGNKKNNKNLRSVISLITKLLGIWQFFIFRGYLPYIAMNNLYS